MRNALMAMAAATAGLVYGTPAVAQDFNWNGQLSPGQTLEIRNINGDIRAMPGGGPNAVVTATKSARRSNPNEVRIEAVPHAGGVTICAIYPPADGRPLNTCEPGGGGSQSTRDNDTTVSFVIQVPQGVTFLARTVNGAVSAESLTGNVDAKTVNGSVNVSTSGAAIANTVNGSITATMGRADWSENASFKTVNGGITLNIGSALDAELEADTLNGTISSDFPVTTTGAISPRRLRGTIGAGGRHLKVSTVNGSIRLLRAQ